MHRAWLIGLSLIGVALSVPFFAATQASAVSTTGTVAIAYPLDGAALGVAGTRIQLVVRDFVLDPNVSPVCVDPSHGRIQLYVNDTFVQETSEANTSVPSLAQNDTKLGAQLVCTDGTPFDPAVWHNITIAVGEPGINILNPGRPLMVSTAGARIAYSVTNFSLDPADYAGPYIPGQGHVHLYRNGTSLIGTSTAPYADISSFPEGPFNLTVELHNNDHSLVTTASHPFGYNDTVAAWGVVPSVRIVSPSRFASVSASGFRLTVAVTGIELDSENYAGPKIPGHGHMHYYIDSGGLAATSTTNYVDFGALSVGAHMFKAELHNNDHSLYTDPNHLFGFNSTVTVTVATASIAILSPANNAQVSTSGFRLSVRFTGFDISAANYGGTNVAGQGHVHYYDGASLLGATAATYLDVGTLTAGTHTIKAELHNNDHGLFSDAAHPFGYNATITLTASGPPEFKILEPVGSSVVSTLGFRMRFAVLNFTLDPLDYAGVSIPGQGHIHVYIGTTLLTTTVTDHIVITGLPAGSATLRVELRNNDHSPLSTPVTRTVNVTVAAPSIVVSAPASITAGEDLLFTWSVTGFVLDGAAFGGTPEAGRGHVHVFVDGTYVAAIPGTSFSVGALAIGSHTIQVRLFNNDHTALAIDVSQQVTVSVNPVAALSPAGVDATVFYGSLGVLAVIIVALAALLARKGRRGPPKSAKAEDVEFEK